MDLNSINYQSILDSARGVNGIDFRMYIDSRVYPGNSGSFEYNANAAMAPVEFAVRREIPEIGNNFIFIAFSTDENDIQHRPLEITLHRNTLELRASILNTRHLLATSAATSNAIILLQLAFYNDETVTPARSHLSYFAVRLAHYVQFASPLFLCTPLAALGIAPERRTSCHASELSCFGCSLRCWHTSASSQNNAATNQTHCPEMLPEVNATANSGLHRQQPTNLKLTTGPDTTGSVSLENSIVLSQWFKTAKHAVNCPFESNQYASNSEKPKIEG